MTMKTKKYLFYGLGASAVLGAIAYFWSKSSSTKDTSSTVSNIDTTDISANSEVVKIVGITINNANMVASPLIGQVHLTASIIVDNAPLTGQLQILLNNQTIKYVNLPLSNGVYALDEYVPSPNFDNAQQLTAKIGSVTKTVSVSV